MASGVLSLALLPVITLLALLNLFGQRPASSTATVSKAALNLWAPARVRGGLLYEARFAVTARTGLDKAVLALDRGWLENITVNSIEPQPVSEGSADGRLTSSSAHCSGQEVHALHVLPGQPDEYRPPNDERGSLRRRPEAARARAHAHGSSLMDIALRAILLYVFVIFVMRVTGRRELSSLSAVDLVLLVILGDAIQQGLTQDDYSVTGALIAVATIASVQVLSSYLGFRSKRAKRCWKGCRS